MIQCTEFQGTGTLFVTGGDQHEISVRGEPVDIIEYEPDYGLDRDRVVFRKIEGCVRPSQEVSHIAGIGAAGAAVLA